MSVVRRLAASLVLSALAAAAQNIPPAAQWLPDGAVYTLSIDQPAALLDLATELKLPALLFGTSTDKGFELLVDTLAKRAGTDWKGLVRNLTGGGITYAMYPGDSSVWIFDAKDGIVLDPLQQFVKTIAGAQHLASPASAKPPAAFYQEYPGNTAVWSLDGKQFFARTGNRLLLASRGDVLKALFTPHPQSSLASSALYTQARYALGDTAAWAYVNMAALNQYPPVQKGLTTGTEPIDVILNGAWKQALRASNWMAVGLTIDGRKLRLHAATDGKLAPAAAGAFTLPGETGLLPILAVPRELAAATLWRDLGKFYAEKETLFPQKTSGGILAENFMEIFFTGRSLADDVFGKFHPQVRLVVARQQYDPAIGTPDEQYPAAALVFRINSAGAGQSADDFAEVMEEAWQKAVGLTNFTRGQQAQPGVIIDRQTYGGVPFTYAYFSARTEKDRAHLPSRFNMRPAIVHDGPYIILSTTDGLARDLIDAVNQEDGRMPAKASGAHTILEVTSPAEIAALLHVNKASMVRQSVLSSGKKPEQAAREFEQNVAWLNRINRATLTFYPSEADLELELK